MSVDVDHARIEELREGGGAADSVESEDAGAGDGGDDALRRDFANPVVLRVADIEVARSVDGEAGGLLQPGVDGGLIVTVVASLVRASDGADDSRGRDLADAIVAGVEEIQGTGGIDLDVGGFLRPGLGGGASVAGESGAVVFIDDDGDDAAGDLENLNAGGDVEIAGGVDGDA